MTLAERRYPDPGPISFDLSTDNGPHRVTWHAGRLVLHEHNIAAERVMRTFGGESCPCLLVFDALSARAADASGFRFDGATLARARQVVQKLNNDNGFLSMPPDQRAEVLRRVRRTLVAALVPRRMVEVLDHADEVGRLRRAPQPAPLPRTELPRVLQDAAEAAVRQAIRARLPESWCLAPVLVECWPQVRGQSRLLHARLTRTGGYLVFSLPFSWLSQVWRRGLSVVDDLFLLRVDRPAPATELAGEAVDWLEGDGELCPVVVPVLLRRYSSGWRLIERRVPSPGSGGSASRS